MEDGEVFDSTLLKETVSSYVATGKRNVIIDLIQLDYIYSDSINVIMFLNKSITEMSGNFALLSPRPEVIQIFQKSGVINSLRIFTSEEEVLRISESYMSQNAGGYQQGQSEFDQLRSEIGSVFGGSSAPVQPAPDALFSQPEQQSQDFGGNVNRYGETGSYGQNVPRQPVSRPMQPQSPYSKPGFPTQQPQFQSRQFAPPPPPVTPVRPTVQPPVQGRTIEPPQKPPVRPPFSADQARAAHASEFSSETQSFQQAPAAQSPKKPETPMSFSFNEELEEITPKGNKFKAESSSRIREESLEGEEDLLDDEIRKKKSPVGLIAVLLVLISGIGFAVLYMTGVINFSKTEQTAKVSEPVPSAVQTTPTPPPVASTPATPPAISEPTLPPPALEPQSVETEKPKVTQRKETQRPAKRISQSRPEPVVQERAVVEPKKTTTISRLQIYSIPTGATVTINGDLIGKTPLSWDKPVFGPLSIQLSKNGYQSTSRDVEFTGGILKQDFTLEKEVAVAPPRPEPVVEPVRPVRQLEPEPEPEPVVRQPEPVDEPPPPRPSTPQVSSAGGDASIFIASIPPVADVYLNGKLVGRTNVSEIKLPSGTLTLRFVKGPKEVTQEVSLQPGKNPSRLVRLP